MKKTLLGTALTASVLGTAVPALAAEFDTRTYLSPMYQHTFAEDGRNANDGKGWYLGAGMPVNPSWNVELGAYSSRFPGGAPAPAGATAFWREVGLELDGLFFYNRNRSFSPYTAFGAGWQKTDVMNTGAEDDSLALNAGFGFMSLFDVAGHDVGLRADARYRVAFMDEIKDGFGDETLSEPLVRVGLVVPLGAKAVAAAPVVAAALPAPAPQVRDSDSDGVIDTSDLCPGTPAGTQVDAKGCALPPPVAINPDLDGDGVANAVDRCPDTPAHFKVDATGCLIAQATSLQAVNFEFGSDRLTSAAKSALDGIAKSLAAQPGVKVKIVGHTDSRGNKATNLTLSKRRAKSVRAYLVGSGIAASRLSTDGKGAASPIASNKTEDGRAQNRRVEFKVTSAQ